MIDNIKKYWKVYVPIFTLLTFSVTLHQKWTYMRKEVLGLVTYEEVEDILLEKQLEKKSGFRHELAEEMKVNVHDVRHKVADAVMWIDSLKTFHKHVWPMLKEEYYTTAVGIYKNRKTGQMYYLALDGLKYTPIWSASHNYYYYYKPDGSWAICQ